MNDARASKESPFRALYPVRRRYVVPRRASEVIMARRTICLGLLICACKPAVSPGFDEPSKLTSQRDAGPHPAAGRPGDPAAWLRRLKARDAEFDNRSIETDKLWVESVSPRGQVAAGRLEMRRFGLPEPGAPPEREIPQDFDQPHRLRQI